MTIDLAPPAPRLIHCQNSRFEIAKMASTSSRIQPLPAEVVAQVKSSVAITSLNDVVLGLLGNSLDAGALKVEINVNFGRGECAVEDDGAGIPPSEFREDGGLGKLYCQ